MALTEGNAQGTKHWSRQEVFAEAVRCTETWLILLLVKEESCWTPVYNISSSVAHWNNYTQKNIKKRPPSLRSQAWYTNIDYFHIKPMTLADSIPKVSLCIPSLTYIFFNTLSTAEGNTREKKKTRWCCSAQCMRTGPVIKSSLPIFFSMTVLHKNKPLALDTGIIYTPATITSTNLIIGTTVIVFPHANRFKLGVINA